MLHVYILQTHTTIHPIIKKYTVEIYATPFSFRSLSNHSALIFLVANVVNIHKYSQNSETVHSVWVNEVYGFSKCLRIYETEAWKNISASFNQNSTHGL